MNFTDQLAATRANLERLEALAMEHPELIEHASGIVIEDNRVRFWIHAWNAPDRDWRAFALGFPGAHWQREMGRDGWNYDGVLGGVQICIIGAEPRKEPEALVAEGAAA